MIRGLIDSARRGAKLRMVSGPTNAGWGGFPMGAQAEGLDYDREAGLRWDNSVVWSCVSFGVRVLNACPIQVGTLDEKLAFHPIGDHDVARLLDRPNEWYDGTLLQGAQVMGEMTRGNSYAFLHRSPAGIIRAIEALPEGSCYPYTEPGSGDFVSEYRLRTATGYRSIPPENVLQLRWMVPDPRNLTLGLGPLEACLPEVVSDKKSGRVRSSLLSNSGVSSTVIAPKGTGGDGDEEFTPAQERQISNKIRDTISGDNVGLPLVFSMPVDVQRLAFDPSQLGLDSVTRHDEERICACYGIMPLSVGMGAGLAQQNNRAGASAAVDATFDSFVLPYMEHREKQLTDRLVPELGKPGQVVRYDRSRIAAIKARLVREIMAKTGGPVETPNEGRGQLGLGPIEGGDVLRANRPASSPTQDRPDEGDDRP